MNGSNPIAEKTNIKVIDKDSDLTIIAFSSNAEKGRFQFYQTFVNYDCNLILVNSAPEEYYHYGIKGIGELTETIDYLKAIIAKLRNKNSRVVTFGCSMGGYGALLYGALLSCHKIYAFSPSCPLYSLRVEVKNDIQRHLSRYHAISSAIFNSTTSKYIVYGGIDYSDYLSFAEFYGLKNNNQIMLKGGSHTIIQPLLKHHGLDNILKCAIDFKKEDLLDLNDDIEIIKSYGEYFLTNKLSESVSMEYLERLFHIDSVFISHAANLMYYEFGNKNHCLDLIRKAMLKQVVIDPFLMRISVLLKDELTNDEIVNSIRINKRIIEESSYIDTMVVDEIKSLINIMEVNVEHGYKLGKDRTKVHAYLLCYNEQDIIRLSIEHYLKFCSKVIILDNNSTDDSVEIASEYPNVHIHKWDSNDELNDLRNVEVKLDFYKRLSRASSGECIENADWIITADMDELLYHPDIFKLLDSYDNESATVGNVVGFNMVSPKFPVSGVPMVEQIKTGFRHDVFDKPIIFKATFDMLFSVGCHPAGTEFELMKTQPNFKLGKQQIALLHYKHIGSRYSSKSKENASRLSSVNLKNKWGSHYLLSDDGMKSRTAEVNKISRIVIDDTGNLIF